MDGGATRSTTDTSPWNYGTSGERAGTAVQVTVDQQALTAIVRTGGAWSVSSTDLAPGVHTVVATITDAAGNSSSASQELTVGTAVPVPGGPGPVDPGPGPVDPGPGPVDPGPGPVPTGPVTPAATYRPDAAIRGGGAKFVGSATYGGTQRVTQQVRQRRVVTFEVRVTNRGNAVDGSSSRGPVVTPSSPWPTW
ncbi:Ig-like domain-containing protein [Nocardioides sp. cx-169]|uniref:Ig-like domain-containing protein n=1 Tax=Nocardioides sp. cx-169 TaxID=2899080 RepID=UPI0035A89FCF